MFFISHRELVKHIRSEAGQNIYNAIDLKWHVEDELKNLIDQQVLDKAWEAVNNPRFIEAIVESINKYQLK